MIKFAQRSLLCEKMNFFFVNINKSHFIFVALFLRKNRQVEDLNISIIYILYCTVLYCTARSLDIDFGLANIK